MLSSGLYSGQRKGYFGGTLYHHNDSEITLQSDGTYSAVDWESNSPATMRFYEGRLSHVVKVGDRYITRIATLSYTGNEGSVIYNERDPYVAGSTKHDWTVQNSNGLLENVDTIEIWPKGTYLKPDSQMALYREYRYWGSMDKHEGEPLTSNVFLAKGYGAEREFYYLFYL
jgi:hypothetical protein